MIVVRSVVFVGPDRAVFLLESVRREVVVFRIVPIRSAGVMVVEEAVELVRRG